MRGLLHTWAWRAIGIVRCMGMVGLALDSLAFRCSSFLRRIHLRSIGSNSIHTLRRNKDTVLYSIVLRIL